VSILAHCAYREFKGTAEDCAGGSVTYTTPGNVLHYSIIDKREEDRLAELKEKEERRKKLQD
jgi:lipoate-protein ligase B